MSMVPTHIPFTFGPPFELCEDNTFEAWMTGITGLLSAHKVIILCVSLVTSDDILRRLPVECYPPHSVTTDCY